MVFERTFGKYLTFSSWEEKYSVRCSVETLISQDSLNNTAALITSSTASSSIYDKESFLPCSSNSHTRFIKLVCTGFWKFDIVQFSLKNGVSVRNMVKITKDFAKVTGANMDAVKLGYGAVSEYRSNTVATLA